MTDRDPKHLDLDAIERDHADSKNVEIRWFASLIERTLGHIPRLVAEVKRLREERDRLREAYWPPSESVQRIRAAEADRDQAREQLAAATSLEDHARALNAEVRRLRKLFDDAGQGEHNVLALVDHYQDASIEADRNVRDLDIRLREARALLTRMAKYVVEDRARTHGTTRLARLTDEVRDYLVRTQDQNAILRSDDE